MSSQQPDPTLVGLKEIQETLDMSRLSLIALEEEVDGYDQHDPRKVIGLKGLMEARFDLSKQYCALAMAKARAGIVGLSWYKPNAEEEPGDD